MNKIVICDSLYSILIYFLISSLDEKTLFLLGKNLKKVNLKKIKYKEIKYSSRNYLFKYLSEKKYYNKILQENSIACIYGNDHIQGANYFLNKKIPFYLLEDGTISYEGPQEILKNQKKISFIKKKLFKLLKIKECYGLNDTVKKIYLTGLAPIPEEIAHKVEIINLKELWNKKTLEEQNEILDIFSFDLNIKEKIKGRDIILFTQPLSEDNVITEEEKLKIYSEIIKKYPKDKLVIKTHPREKTDYKDVFKEYLVLDNPFPFEILNLLDVKFNKAITLFSTAALGLGEGVEVDFYGTEVHVKILERFGSCDNIMKRNCFLKEE